MSIDDKLETISDSLIDIKGAINGLGATNLGNITTYAAAITEYGAGAKRNIGEIVASTIPLTDAGLHLLDGALIQGGGSYADFVTYIASLYTADPTANYFMQPSTERTTPFVQPALSANGTMGGSSFAVAASSEYDSSRQAWKAFDGIADNAWQANGANPQWLAFYNPTPLRVSQIVCYTPYIYMGDYTVQGSNDYSNWTDIVSGTGTSSTTTIDMSSNTSAYLYHRIYITSNGGGSSSYYVTMDTCQITAVEVFSEQHTAEENWQSAVSTYGVCGKFVYDSVNNTVRLPKYSNKIYTKDLANTAGVKGNGMTLGLTDGITNYGLQGSPYNGYKEYLLPKSGSYGSNIGGTNTSGSEFASYGQLVGVTTDATKSGIIADLSNITISLDGYYYIVVATSTKTDIQVDIDEIATDLNGKADRDLTNLSNTGLVKGASLAMPSSTYDDLTVGATGTFYTAPANGWFAIRALSGSNACGIGFFNVNSSDSIDIGLGIIQWCWSSGMGMNLFYPIQKGRKVYLWYQGSPTISSLRFYYAQGSESEAS